MLGSAVLFMLLPTASTISVFQMVNELFKENVSIGFSNIDKTLVFTMSAL